LARMFQRLRKPRGGRTPLPEAPAIPVPAEAIRVLSGPTEFRTVLLERIASARQRILLVALYLQDDASGREILDALYAAHRANPALDIKILVDAHRAQRGLIGKVKSPGNAALYRDYAARLGEGVKILGVPVQSRELFGVLHLKGFVFDDVVLYSGASLNDVYLGREGRYRLDRYHLIASKPLADCLAAFIQTTFLDRPAVASLNLPVAAPTRKAMPGLKTFRRELKTAQYSFTGGPVQPGEVGVTPLVGLGAASLLNEALLDLVKSAQHSLVIYTPYFNLPGSLRRAVSRQLAQGREVTIVVGDKTASDFFVPPAEPFRIISLLPYLYEANLRRFTKTHKKAMAEGRLQVYLWKDGDNTFHLKGLFVDHEVSVVTGNNLNPRAWNLDLENGLVLRDPEGLLREKHQRERAAILAHTTRLGSFQDLETPSAYPIKVQKALKQMSRTRLDRLVNRLL
jgi:CDP-diacylglycerol--serine O-phosphatidyltransferase